MDYSAPSNAFEFLMKGLSIVSEDKLKESIPVIDTFSNYMRTISSVIEYCERTGSVPPNTSLADLESEDGTDFTLHTSRISVKENTEPNIQASTPWLRPKRNAAMEATLRISQSSCAKPMGPTNVDGNFRALQIKKEKLSIEISQLAKEKTDKIPFVDNIKKEAEEMPAPKKPAPRAKRQKEIKQEKLETLAEKPSEGRESNDVILQEAPIPMVEITDSDDDKNAQSEVRTTRTKTRQQNKNAKSNRNITSDDEVEKMSTMSKKLKSVDVNLSTQTEYNDALSTLIPDMENNNATYIAEPSKMNEGTPVMNATVVIENPQIISKEMSNVDGPLSEEILPEIEEQKISKTVQKTTKPIFSAFENSPVKKKVEAFEKLLEGTNALPTRTTQTKTRALAKAQGELPMVPNTVESLKSVKEKAKFFTPIGSKFLPGASSTVLKNSTLSHTSSDTSVGPKPLSALKVSQAEYREREKRRKEKEEEILRKREALRQAQIEEKKRKREEKQLKAQQQREALEKQKLKAIEAHKLKEERNKQLLQEQEEKKLRIKEEAHKKRVIDKTQAVEEKKKELVKKQKLEQEVSESTTTIDPKVAKWARRNKLQKISNIPKYMRTPIPVLPTVDCYDSDDARYEERKEYPHWTKANVLLHKVMCQQAIGESLKNSFFSRLATTADLQEIFEVIDPELLKRKSSAVWHKPPRFSILPKQFLESQPEESGDEDN